MKAFALLALAACHTTTLPPEHPLYVVPLSPAEATPATTFDGFGDRQAVLVEAIADAEGIVNSDDFRNRFGQVNDVAVTPLGPIMSGQTILDAYATRVPIHYIAHGETETDTHFNVATSHIGDETLARWVALANDNDVAGRVRRACVINQLAHEWVHAVPDPGNPYGTTLFFDEGHESSTYPLVSFTVGAIAQCTYLVKYGVLVEDQLWSCVHAIGTRAFDGKRVCESTDWLARVTHGATP